MLAVQVLVQAVVVALFVLQDERRRAPLSCGVTALEVGLVLVREARLDAERGVPAVGDLCEPGIERRALRGNDLGQRIVEVLVFAAAEAVARHDYAAAEEIILFVQRSERAALRR